MFHFCLDFGSIYGVCGIVCVGVYFLSLGVVWCDVVL